MRPDERDVSPDVVEAHDPAVLRELIARMKSVAAESVRGHDVFEKVRIELIVANFDENLTAQVIQREEPVLFLRRLDELIVVERFRGRRRRARAGRRALRGNG